jgi:pimeloyl-ACP methyl ester carboxylesterase
MTSYQYAVVDGYKIFYREADPKTAPTILLLHGFPTSSHMFRNLIPALADRYHVVAPDLPGFGFSQVPDCTQMWSSFWAVNEEIVSTEEVNTRIGLLEAAPSPPSVPLPAR